jgi:predicted acyltransferase
MSVDVLRGLTLIGMIVVNTAAALEKSMLTFPALLHSQWDGFTIADAVFPAFLFVVGVSIPLALRREAQQAVPAGATRHIIQRSLILILLGFLLHNLGSLADFSRPLRVFGVLQRIGLAYGMCAFLFLYVESRIRLIVITVLLLGYWALLYIPSPDGLATDLWLRGHNFAAGVDRLLLGEHRYVKGPEGYDPEGPLGDIPSIAHCLIGVAVGEYLQRNRGARAAVKLIVMGVLMVAAGAAWGYILPVVKSIWSPSFVILGCGLTMAALGVLHALLDNGQTAARNPLVTFCLAFGANSIVAYILHVLASGILGADLFTVPYASLAPRIGGQVAELVPILTFLILIWLPLEYLRRKRWIVKI